MKSHGVQTRLQCPFRKITFTSVDSSYKTGLDAASEPHREGLYSTQLCGRPVNPFLSHMFTYKPLTLNSIASFGHTMYKERLEGFPFMTEMDIKQMAV